jgi:hypothetical protein
MAGTVDGRTVRAFTYTVQKGGSAEGGGRSVTYTVGEASQDYGNHVLTTRVRNALGDPGGADAVIVGDPTDAIMAAVPEDFGGALGSMVVSKIRDKISDRKAFKAGMVSHSDKGLLLDADELGARIEAVAATAEAGDAASRETVDG